MVYGGGGSAETEGLGMGLRNADLLGMEFYLWDYGEPVLVYILYKHGLNYHNYLS